MKQGQDRNHKIGRPTKTERGLQFKKQYQNNQIKFELQCQLLVTIHQDYFVEPPTDSQNRRVQISYITALFQKHDCMKVYQVLLKLNQFYYKNSSVYPSDILKYTSLIDVAYMFKQLRLNIGQKLRSVELVLTIIFFLYNQKLINLRFYEYIQEKINQIAEGILVGPTMTKKFDKVQLLFVTLILQIAVKQQIKLKK